MWNYIKSYFCEDLAIDIGFGNTLIYLANKGIILDEPSLIAINKSTNEIKAIGKNASDMIGKLPSNIQLVSPIKSSEINLDLTEKMLKYFIKSVNKNKLFKSPRVILCVPSNSTQTQRKAIRKCAKNAGASQVFLIEQPMAAALGAGIDVSTPNGSMIIDIGADTTEIGVISLGGMLYKSTQGVGGTNFDNSIINYIKKNYNIQITKQVAENIKISIGSAFPVNNIEFIKIKGKNLSEGTNKEFSISSNEILEALENPVFDIINSIKNAINNTPEEIKNNINEKGIVIAGGGALLKNLDRLISEETKLPVIIAEDPITCVVRGCGIALQRMDKLSSIFDYE